MAYRCEICDYSTNRKTDYNRHLGTEKHEKKVKQVSKVSEETRKTGYPTDTPVQKKYICRYCKGIFSAKGNLYRHMNHRCKKNPINLKRPVKQKKSSTQVQNKYINVTNNNNYNIIYTGEPNYNVADISNMLNTIYNDAPTLTKLDDDTIELFIRDRYKTDVDFAKKLCNQHYDKRLTIFVCELIENMYKPEKLYSQSFWFTDSARHSGLIKVNEECPIWCPDKQAKNILNWIINPFIKYLEKVLNLFIVDITGNLIEIDFRDNYIKEAYETRDFVIKNLRQKLLAEICGKFAFNRFQYDKYIKQVKEDKLLEFKSDKIIVLDDDIIDPEIFTNQLLKNDSELNSSNNIILDRSNKNNLDIKDKKKHRKHKKHHQHEKI